MAEKAKIDGDRKAPLEIYVHIPFCVKKCDYCDFLSGPAALERQEQYTEALLKEIDSVKEGEDRPVVSVFIGGGTPSILPPSFTGRIVDAIKEKYNMTPDAEITTEANPGSLSWEKLETYLEHGINRLSLGLQSPVEQELKMLGRIHTYGEFLESFSMARKAGFSNINVDLMCAIPNQTYEGWMNNLRTAAELGMEHISAYSLIVEEGTPFAKRVLSLPDEDTEYRMYEDTAGLLAEYGYHQYEISNYAKKGYECRHNIGYWRRRDYLGFGLGAASLYNGVRFSNTGDMDAYLKDSRCPEKSRKEQTKLTVEDAMAEFMFLGLRMTEGVIREDFSRDFGCSIDTVYGEILAKYKSLSMLMEEDGRIFLTRMGIHVSNSIMADFL